MKLENVILGKTYTYYPTKNTSWHYEAIAENFSHKADGAHKTKVLCRIISKDNPDGETKLVSPLDLEEQGTLL